MINQNAHRDDDADDDSSLLKPPKNKPKKLKKHHLSPSYTSIAAASLQASEASSSSSSSTSSSIGPAATDPATTATAKNSNNASGMSSLKFSLMHRVDLSSKLIENNADLALNCVQLINFIEFYFNDAPTNSLAPSAESTSSAAAIDRPPLTSCFPCIVCSTQFSFDQTFHMHLERKSAVIRVYCVKCDSLKKFYNKCKLLYHVYSHKTTLLEPIYRSLQIESLPVAGGPDSTGPSLQSLLAKERTIDTSLIFGSPENTHAVNQAWVLEES